MVCVCVCATHYHFVDDLYQHSWYVASVQQCKTFVRRFDYSASGHGR